MGTAVNNVVEGEVGSWLKDVANSSWYDYIGAIINCAQKVVVEIVQYRSNVMVHCSDGWDRTAQTTSLSMLCIDQHYRTQAGFLKLVQKEWCAFGHKFRTRAALGEAPTSEASPVFVQWLEAVYQVVLQNPSCFEFTPAVLLRLANEVYSNRFGTFLTDCERERLQTVAGHTLSLWSFLLSPAEAASWRNPSYRPHPKPLVPSISQANFIVWEAYWFRYHPRRLKLAFGQVDAPPVLGRASSQPAEARKEPELVDSSASVPKAADPLKSSGLPPSALPSLDAPLAAASERTPPPVVEEVAPAPTPAPKQYFQDDDDEDIFAPKK
jgi:hypothetical protein